MFLVNSVWQSSPSPPCSPSAKKRQVNRGGEYLSNFDYQTSNMREIPMEDLEIAMKVVIVGNGSVGKSSMIQRFCRGIFTRDYKKTIGVDFLERILTVEEQPVRLMLWDTAGQEEFDAITRTYYRGAHACVLACSVTDKESFLALPKWKNKVCRECGDIPMVLVANKIDLQKEAVIDTSELDTMARSLGLSKLIKTSVKDDVNVSTVFSYLAQSYMTSMLSQDAVDLSPSLRHPYISTDHHHNQPVALNTSDKNLSLNQNHHPSNNKSASQTKGNNKKNGNLHLRDQVTIINGNNKNAKTGNKSSLFRNPIILKSSQPISSAHPSTPSPPPTNGSSGGFAGFFSKNKQNNFNHHQVSPPNNGVPPQQQQQINLFHRSRSNKYPGGVLPPPVALLGGQMMHRPAYTSPHQFINGHHHPIHHPLRGGGGEHHLRHNWNDSIPFRLDLVKDRKRQKETSSCTIL